MSDREQVMKLLLEAKELSDRLHEPILEYLIERAIDEARASAYMPQQKQEPYEVIPPNVTALIMRAAKRGGRNEHD